MRIRRAMRVSACVDLSPCLLACTFSIPFHPPPLRICASRFRMFVRIQSSDQCLFQYSPVPYSPPLPAPLLSRTLAFMKFMHLHSLSSFMSLFSLPNLTRTCGVSVACVFLSPACPLPQEGSPFERCDACLTHTAPTTWVPSAAWPWLQR